MGHDRARRGGGPLGLLVKAVGNGVGIAAEYHEHRKQRKNQLSRQSSTEDDQHPVAGPSSSADQRGQSDARTSFAPASPPPYAESINRTERSIDAAPRNLDDKEKATSLFEESMSEDEDLDRDLVEHDEEDWALDEAQPPTYEESESGERSTDALVSEVLQISPSSRSALNCSKPLAYPVIIPQRRPGSKSRGFIRAYAPVLEECGIDQATFLAFLKNFHQSSKASPIFPIIQVSCAIAGLAPSVIAMAVTTVVGAAASVGAELQGRQRTNNFLDRMNQELFQPAGLYAMIMKYKPDTNTTALPGLLGMFTVQKADLSTDQMIAKYSRNLLEGNKNGRAQKFRMGNGTTRGAIALPEAAPLIFPELDQTIANSDGKETFKDRTKDAKKFFADYIDRRAQMKYASQDPDSSLAVPIENRKSKAAWANPDHAMYKGGLINLVTGGALQRNGARGPIGLLNLARPGSQDGRAGSVQDREIDLYERRERRITRYEQDLERGRDLSAKQYVRYERLLADREWREQRSMMAGSSGGMYGGQRRSSPRQGRQNGGPIRRLMKEDVLYLMIVNLPSEEELMEARRQLQQR